jgi:hypothetical protein
MLRTKKNAFQTLERLVFLFIFSFISMLYMFRWLNLGRKYAGFRQFYR